MKVYNFTKSQLITRPLPEVFAFFASPENLGKITPKSLEFKITSTLPIEMKKGAIIDYRIRLNAIPLKWRTLISEYEHESRFVDEQLRGPYAFWRHEHVFRSVDEGTLIVDNLNYALPLGIIGRVAHALFVKKRVEEIFRYREEVIETIFQKK